jgi:hypothetical protein
MRFRPGHAGPVSANGERGEGPGHENAPGPPRVIPGLLIAAAVALVIYAGIIRTNVSTSSRTTVSSPPAPTATSGKALVITKQTTTATVPSDTLLGVLFGTAGVLALCGAFYSRVLKITLPGGGGVELAALKSDLAKAENAVPQLVQEKISELPPEQQQALNAADVTRITAQAVFNAQRALIEARATRNDQRSTTTITVPEITPAGVGMPLSDELVNHLVAHAVGQAVNAARPTDGD